MAWRDLPVSVDLTTEALKQIDFLLDVDRSPELCTGQALLRAIDRYQRCWLPLAAKHQLEVLAAPLDIEWVWHCHMLSPVTYQKDCQELVGTLVDHQVLSRRERKELTVKTAYLWGKEYSEERFSVDEFSPEFTGTGTGIETETDISAKTISYDIVSAAARQKEFLYQVLLPHYRDPRYRRRCLERYKKFLYLQQKYPDSFIVPCYGIDLIWHSHQLNPMAYRKDTRSTLGRTLNHDDTMNDRSPDSKLNNAFRMTRKLWRETFSENYAFSGAMYRGESSKGKMSDLTDEEVRHLTLASADLTLSYLQVDRVPTSVRIVKLELNSFSGKHVQKVFSSKEWTNKGKMEWKIKKLFKGRMEVEESPYLEFKLTGISGYGIFLKQRHLGQGKIDVLPLIKAMDAKRVDVAQQVTLSPSPIKLSLQGKLKNPGYTCKVVVKAGEFQKDCAKPDQRGRIWGPVPLPETTGDLSESWEEATHTLTLFNQDEAFKVKVIHSTDLMMSAIYVYHKNKLLTCAHLIGPDQLPHPSIVKRDFRAYVRDMPVTLDFPSGERAVIIKNNRGDWGVVTGKWTDVLDAKGSRENLEENRIPKRKSISGNRGYFHAKFYECSRKQLHEDTVKRNFNFRFGDTLGFPSEIHIRSKHGDVAENVALTFSVSLLHSLCQPRPEEWTPGTSLSGFIPKGQMAGIPCEDVGLLAAVGVTRNCPSNFYIRTSYRSDRMARLEAAREARMNTASSCDSFQSAESLKGSKGSICADKEDNRVSGIFENGSESGFYTFDASGSVGSEIGGDGGSSFGVGSVEGSSCSGGGSSCGSGSSCGAGCSSLGGRGNSQGSNQ